MGFLHGLAHGIDDFVVIRRVEVQCVDMNSAARCEHTLWTGEFGSIKFGVHEKSVPGLERVVFKVDTAITDNSVPCVDKAIFSMVWEIGCWRGRDRWVVLDRETSGEGEDFRHCDETWDVIWIVDDNVDTVWTWRFRHSDTVCWRWGASLFDRVGSGKSKLELFRDGPRGTDADDISGCILETDGDGMDDIH